MVGIDNPDDWNHKLGYHLKGDGSRIMYEREDGEYTAWVEAESGSHFTDGFGYRVWIFDKKKNAVIHPEPYESKDSSIRRLEEVMKEWQIE